MNCGQVCICNERTLVHRSIYDQFVTRFVEFSKSLVVGDPMQANTDIGPKVSRDELEKVEAVLAEAVAGGARLALAGGRPTKAPIDGGYWLNPTVLTDVTPDMDAGWPQLQVAGISNTLKDLGIEVVGTTDAKFQPGQQISDLEQMIARKPDVIFSIPIDPKSESEAYKKAAAAGIKLVFMTSRHTFRCRHCVSRSSTFSVPSRRSPRKMLPPRW